VAKPSREPQGRLIGPAWDENLDVAVSLDHVANDPNAHASPMRRASLIKNEGTTVKAEANESSRDMPRLRLRLLSRPVSCDCSTPPNPHPGSGNLGRGLFSVVTCGGSMEFTDSQFEVPA
jgi:hypothetical protein